MTEPTESVRRRAKEIFEQIVDLAAPQRAVEIALLAGEDEAVRAEVESLLGAHDGAQRFLRDPTLERAAGAMLPEAAARFEGVGSQIGPYRLMEVIGEGGFGTVFLAVQEQPVRRRVALKLIRLGMDTSQVVARFEAERQALAMMDHPNIARVYDAGATPTGRPFFVMELVEGVPITRWCDEHRLTLRERLELFAPVLQAVQHAHSKGIIHRDVKPSNVLVALQDGRPVPKVIDFGIAKATDARLTERTIFTEQRQLIGTPEYMSPEQAQMDSRDVDTRSDIYSLGVLLYELLTGTTPFDARELRSKAFAEMQRTIREVDPPRPSTRLSEMRDSLPSVAANRSTEPARLSSTIRGELDWIVMKCLEKDRARRYQTAAALHADLLHYLADEPVSAAAPSRAYLLRKFARRHRLGLSAAGAVLAVLLIGLIAAAWGFIEARRERDAAIDARNDAVDARNQAEAARAAEAEAREYEKQTDIFLRDMFESIEPARAQGQQVLVRDVLDAATRRLDAQPPTHPIVEASLRYTFGRAYSNLGLLDIARPQLERAVEIYRAQRGADYIGTGKALSMLGEIYLQQGQFELAERTYREAADLHLRRAGPDDQETIYAQNQVAEVLNRRGDVAGADAILSELLPRVRKVKGADSDDVIVVLDTLAYLRSQQGRYAEAEQFYREGLASAGRAHGPDHPANIVLSGNLGNLLRQTGRFDEAITLLAESREAAERIFGPEHSDTLAAGNNLGLMLQAAGRLDEARTVFEQTLELRRRILGEEHPATLTSRANLALLLAALRRFDEAEAEILAVTAARRRLLGPDHRDTLLLESNLGQLRLQADRAAEAESLLRDLLPRARAALGDANPVTVVTMLRLGQAWLALDRAADAEPLLAEAHATALKLGIATTQPPYAQAWGTALVKLGRAREGLPMLVAADEMHGRLPAPDAQARRRLFAAIVEAHEQLGDAAEAARWRGRLEELEAVPATYPATAPATRPG